LSMAAPVVIGLLTGESASADRTGGSKARP
jgi:hypothetical protein